MALDVMGRFRGVRRRHHQSDRKDDRGEIECSHCNTPANGKRDPGRRLSGRDAGSAEISEARK